VLLTQRTQLEPQIHVDWSDCTYKRLHLAASRFEHLESQTLKLMANPSWVHFGEAERTWQQRLQTEWSVRNFRNCLHILYRIIKPRHTSEELKQYYHSTSFFAFNYRGGDQFKFPDGSFDFIYSEHFFEHLFADEAVALLRECHRLLKPGGVIRTVVPDADLRTYEAPEPAGFPGKRVGWDDPDKHKTRWSVYSLPGVIEKAGLKPFPLVYCDRHGNFFQSMPTDASPGYECSQDKAMINSFDYIRRPLSLIVDGVKSA
jgi:predicted SAM-dependent methyltransferase